MKKVNIAIIGLGNIGSSLFAHLRNNRDLIRKQTNVDLNVKYVSAKNRFKKRKIKVSNKKWLKSYKLAPYINDIDIIVELIGSEGAAKKLVFNSIKNKKHVVTANKALISKYGDKLAKLAEQNNVNLEFEASVAGGVQLLDP